jgi:hypothetical protein
MTLRIDRQASGDRTIVHLIGSMRVEHLDEVKAQLMVASRHVALDVGELTLVSVEGVRFLNACQDEGIAVLNASPYISEWMMLERRARTKGT